MDVLASLASVMGTSWQVALLENVCTAKKAMRCIHEVVLVERAS